MSLPVTALLPVQLVSAMTNKTIPYSAADVSNPSRGQYENIVTPLFPQSNSNQSSYPNWPKAHDTNLRIEWKTLQPLDPTTLSADAADSARYDFSFIDTQLEKNAKEGKRTSMRISAFNSCCRTEFPGKVNSSVPNWLRDKSGATEDYLLNGITHVIPDWDNATYQTEMIRLITALGKKYNRDERLSVFEFSGYGDFSENHNAFMRDELQLPAASPEKSIKTLGYYSQYKDQYITKASIKKLVTATFDAFPDTQIIAAPGNPEIMKQLLRDSSNIKDVIKPVGFRSDCLGTYSVIPTWAENQYSYYVKEKDPIVATMQTQSTRAPIVTEWCNFGSEDKLAYYTKGLKDVINHRVSMLASTGFPDQLSKDVMPKEQYDIWSRANKYSGYRYGIKDIQKTYSDINTYQFSVDWTNTGSASTYEDWQVHYELQNQAGEVKRKVTSALQLHDIINTQDEVKGASSSPPPSSMKDTATFDISNLEAGTYTVAAKVVWNEHKKNATETVMYPPMNLALQDRNADGSYPLEIASFGMQSQPHSRNYVGVIIIAIITISTVVVVLWKREAINRWYDKRH